jgi:hypothetical protein
MTETKKPYKDETPYIAVDLLTNENLTRHATMIAGYDAYRGKRQVAVYYRPRKRRTKGRTFP